MNALENAKRLKAELDSFRPLTGEIEARIMQKFRLDWNYHSNKLEGNSYTYGETKMLLLYGLTAGGKPINDYKEISGHNEAIETIIEVIKDKTPLTETFIRHLHTLILEEQWVEAKTADGKPTKRLIKVGEYKTEPNHVETVTGEMFYFSEPIETPAKMQELIEWFNQKKSLKDTNPIFLAAEFHYKFIRIHPFDDGNGRMARLLMNFILMQNGFPPVIIKDNDKANYIAVLRQTDVGIIQPFIEYIAENLVRSLEIMIKGAKGESIEEADDLDKELALLENEIRSVGTKVSASRNRDSLLSIYDSLIVPLTKEFINVCEKFDKFYNEKMFVLSLDGSGNNTNDQTLNEVLKAIRNRLEQNDLGNSNSIELNYFYKSFIQDGFGSFDYDSAINIKFEGIKFKVSIINYPYNLEKTYSEKLFQPEINQICKAVAEAHKHLIEARLMEINQSPS
jgi:Fic family protein